MDKYLNFFSDYAAEDVFRIYEEYQKQLNKNNAVDFDDLLVKTVELFINNPQVLEKYQNIFEYILVDEFQDTRFCSIYIDKNY
ncbi:MAG: hypothetical protein KatS3mg092_0907 [Patescibacteria group bacterium]|nr:MAG: hypothetical protein KatS3mg092_0907 [Patescibacteria group bacterium]